nr:MAG TPA: hypothetical protein [Bacteriophage sp.]
MSGKFQHLVQFYIVNILWSRLEFRAETTIYSCGKAC